MGCAWDVQRNGARDGAWGVHAVPRGTPTYAKGTDPLLCTAATVTHSSGVSGAEGRPGPCSSPAAALPHLLAPCCPPQPQHGSACHLLLPLPLIRALGALSPGSWRAGRRQQLGVCGAAALTAPYFTAIGSGC